MKVQLPLLATAAVAAASAVVASPVASSNKEKRQSYQTHNLTPDGYWHNRYHMLLSMAAYGQYDTLCPNQTFTPEAMERNFPDSTRPPWTLVSKFGPTPSGCEGFTAIVPEMNKALIVFKGNYELEKTLPVDVVGWNEVGLGRNCNNCTVNAYAMQGYMECRNETNNWEAIREAYYGQDLVFSVTGHGLGGMHSQIAGIDLYEQEIDYYNHAYGSPRVFNAAGAQNYDDRFNGEAGERGVANNDQITEIIPEGPNYAHAGTPFYYSGYNHSSTGMNMRICWTEDDPDYSDCMPRATDGLTAEQSHFFYFSNVGQCGGDVHPDTSIINSFVQAADGNATSAALSSSSSSSSSSVAPSTSALPPPTSAPPPAPAPTAAGEGSGEGNGAQRSVVGGAMGMALVAGLVALF